MSYFIDRIKPWHGEAKSKSENTGGNSIFKNSERGNNFEVEKVGRKNSVILNHVDSNHTNSNHVNSNHYESNQLVPSDLTTLNDSDDVRELNKLLS